MRQRRNSGRQCNAARLPQTSELLNLVNAMAWTMDDRITYWTRGAEESYGWAQQEALGASPWELLHTVFPHPLNSIKEALLQKGLWDGELLHTRKDGTQVTVASHWILKRSANGTPETVLEIDRDITGQKPQTGAAERPKSQASLKEQSRFLESFFEHSINPLVFLDRDFNFIRVNQAYARADGARQPEDFVGRNHFDLYPSAENEAIFREVVRTRTPYTALAQPFTYPGQLERGATYWNWTLVPVLDAGGEIDFLFLALTDVTRAKRAERELLSSYHYSRSLLEASLDPLVTISIEGKITDVNEATELATGVPRQQLIGSDFSSYFTDPEKAGRGYQQVFQDGLVRDYQLTIRHVSGARTDVLYNAAVYRNEAGEIQGVFAAARDITQLKAAERRRDFTNALLELFAQKTSLKDYLDAVLSILKDWAAAQALGIRILGADGNIPFLASYGFSPDFLSRENKLSLSAGDCICTRSIAGAFEVQDHAAVTAGGSFFCANSLSLIGSLPAARQKRYRGECVRCGFRSLMVIPINYLGRPIGAIHMADSREGFFSQSTVEFLESISPLIGEAIQRFRAEEELSKYRDQLEELVRQRTEELQSANEQLHNEIAERKAVEQNLSRAAEDLARSNRDLEQFAYVASHDLQEPLRAVSGYIQLLQQRYADRLDEKALQYVAGAVDGAGRMQKLIIDLLEFSRVGTRGKALVTADLALPLKAAMQNLRTGIVESGARITCEELPSLEIDFGQMVQVFQNLIGNALKFRSLQPPEIHIGAREENGEWTVFVRDNGIGIEPQYAERIFMIFQRLHTRRAYPGTGIGLAICKRIVERHRGRIWVDSQPGAGATFYFTLPAATSQTQRPEAAPSHVSRSTQELLSVSTD